MRYSYRASTHAIIVLPAETNTESPINIAGVGAGVGSVVLVVVMVAVVVVVVIIGRKRMKKWHANQLQKDILAM